MKKILTVSLVLLGLLIATFLPVSAQSSDEWTDVDVLLGKHPEIVAQTLSRVGVTTNSGSYFAGYDYLGQTCESPYDFDPEATVTSQHADQLFFIYDIESIEENLYSHVGDGTQLTLVSHKDYYLDGFHVLVWKYEYSTTMINQGYLSFGYIELPNQYDYWQGFSISENCEDSFGVHMPDIEEVLSTFMVVLKDYGFTTPSDLATQMAGMPSPTPYVYEAVPLSAEEALESADEVILGDDETMDEGLAPATVGGAALGALLGALLMQLIPALRSPTSVMPKPIEPIYYSPATGQPAPLEQVQEEQARMAEGYVYRDGAWYAPTGEYRAEGPSIVTRLAEEERARLRKENERYEAERKDRMKQERIKEFSDMADRHVQANQESLDRVLTGIDIAEAGIETTIDVGAALLIRRFPVKSVGRAQVVLKVLGKKWLQPAVSAAYDQVRITSKNVVKWARGEETSVIADEAIWLLTLPFNLIPGGRFANPARAFAEEAAKGVAKTGISKAIEKPVNNKVDNFLNSTFYTGN